MEKEVITAAAWPGEMAKSRANSGNKGSVSRSEMPLAKAARASATTAVPGMASAGWGCGVVMPGIVAALPRRPAAGGNSLSKGETEHWFAALLVGRLQRGDLAFGRGQVVGQAIDARAVPRLFTVRDRQFLL
ncbi:MAG: hypothetical protein ABI781_14680 [Burkholderiales bacterium]